MSAPTCGVSNLALVGGPPEHRQYRHLIDHPRPDIHPTALVEAFVSVDSGTVRPTQVGARTWLMKHTHIGHDAIVGDDCELSPGAVVCGFAEIGNGVRMGVNSCVRPFIKVGDGARIGMGAVVVKDIPAGECWVGNPASRMKEGQEKFLLWAAGLFEGEGWIYTNRSCTYRASDNKKTIYLSPRLGLESTDQDVVEKFYEVVGCGHLAAVRTRDDVFPNAKPIHRWVAGSKSDVVMLASRLRPYLSERRNQQIDKVFEECGLIESLETDDAMWRRLYDRA